MCVILLAGFEDNVSMSKGRSAGEDKIRMMASFATGAILLAAVLFGLFWFPFATGELKQYSVAYQTGAAEYFANAGGDVNSPDDQNQTPLLVAAGYGNVELVCFLLNHGAKIEARDNDGNTPLIEAVKQLAQRTRLNADFSTTVGVLLAYHADVNARNKRGETALSLAQAQKNKAIVAQLQRTQE